METIILDINGNELHDGDKVCIRIDNLDKYPGYYHEAIYVFSTHPIFGMRLKIINLTTQNNDTKNQYIGRSEFTISDIKLYIVERSGDCIKYKFGIVGDKVIVSFKYTDNIQKV